MQVMCDVMDWVKSGKLNEMENPNCIFLSNFLRALGSAEAVYLLCDTNTIKLLKDNELYNDSVNASDLIEQLKMRSHVLYYLLFCTEISQSQEDGSSVADQFTKDNKFFMPNWLWGVGGHKNTSMNNDNNDNDDNQGLMQLLIQKAESVINNLKENCTSFQNLHRTPDSTTVLKFKDFLKFSCSDTGCFLRFIFYVGFSSLLMLIFLMMNIL